MERISKEALQEVENLAKEGRIESTVREDKELCGKIKKELEEKLQKQLTDEEVMEIVKASEKLITEHGAEKTMNETDLANVAGGGPNVQINIPSLGLCGVAAIGIAAIATTAVVSTIVGGVVAAKKTKHQGSVCKKTLNHCPCPPPPPGTKNSYEPEMDGMCHGHNHLPTKH